MLSNLFHYWQWYLIGFIVLCLCITFIPVLSTIRDAIAPFIKVIAEKFSAALGWLLDRLGAMLKIGLPDIFDPIQTLFTVLLLMGLSFGGGYLYHTQDDCPAVSQEVRKKYRLVPRKKTTPAYVQNYWPF